MHVHVHVIMSSLGQDDHLAKICPLSVQEGEGEGEGGYTLMSMTLLSFCIRLSRRSPCFTTDWEGGRGSKLSSTTEPYLPWPHLVEEVLAVWSVRLHNSTHFVNAAVQTPRGDEL